MLWKWILALGLILITSIIGLKIANGYVYLPEYLVPYYESFYFYLVLGILISFFGFWLKKTRNAVRLNRVIKEIFGKISWDSPEWMKATSRRGVFKSIGYYLKSRKVWIVSCLCAIAFGGLAFLNHLSEKPRISDKVESVDKTVKVTLNAPSVTEFNKGSQGEVVVQTRNLVVNFSGNAADLKMRDKVVKEGISIVPALDGEWKWYGQDSIIFNPKKDWDVGENYIVKIEKKLVAENVSLSTNELRFKTAPFSGYSTNSELYENPIDPLDKKVVTSFNFSHPVDADKLKPAVSVKLFNKVADGWSFQSEIDFKLIKNGIGLSYSVHSDKIGLTNQPQRVTITVTPSLSSDYASKALVEKIENQTIIPSIDQFYYFDAPNVQLVENAQGEQEQVLHISSSTAIKVEDLTKYIEVFQLPLNKKKYFNDILDIPNDIFKAKRIVNLIAMPTEREFAKEHFFKISVEQGGQLAIFLKQGLPSFEGYKLTADQQYLTKIPNYSSVAKILPAGNILRLDGDGRASLMMRNVKKATVEIAQVLKNQIHHYLIQNSGDMTNPSFNSYQISEQHISRKIEQEFVVPKNNNPNQSHFELIDLKKLLKRNFSDAKGRGIFLIKVKKDSKYNVSDSRLIILSDYAMIAKKQSDDSYEVFVYNISTQTAAMGVKVEVIGKNGLPIFTRKTDSNGKASFPKLRPTYNDPQPVAFIARKGNNVSFMKVNDYNRQLYYYSSDTGGVYEYGDVANKLKAFVFSDRKMYRPGEKAWFGSIIKDGKWSNNYSGQLIEYELYDPNGRSIYKQRLDIGSFGINELSYHFTPTDKTGDYSVRVNLIGEKNERNFLGSTTIKVEEFQPDRIKIQANFKRPKVEDSEGKVSSERAWFKPSEVTVLGSLRNLFGTPVTDSAIRLDSKVMPTSLSFGKFPEYRFSHFNQIKKSVSLDQIDFKTDGNGEFTQNLDLEKFANNTFRVFVDIEGFEKEGGRSVKTRLSHLVSSHDFLIGVKSEDLNFTKEGDKRIVSLMAIDSNFNLFEPENLQYELYKKTPIRTLVKQANGTFKYEKLIKEEKIEITPLAFEEGKIDIELNTSMVGDFFIDVIDVNNTKFARVNYSVVGKSNARIGQREANLEIKLSKNDYSHGETIEIEVKSPFSGAGLVTIERDKIYQAKWFEIKGDKEIVKIKVPREVEGNAYINVIGIKSARSSEILMNPISYQVKNFSINRDKRKLDVELAHEPLLKPNQKLKIKYKTSAKSKLILFGIDEGILQVAKYKTPQPLDFFLSKKALSVTSYQTLDMILSDAAVVKKFAPGGGKGGALASNLNPFARKALDPVVFWSGVLDAGKKEKTFEYSIPDYFNGKMRIIAIAVNNDRVGVKRTFLTVRGDFVIMPNVPTFVAPNDQFDVTVILANNLTGEEEKMPISLKAVTGPGIEVQGNDTQTKEIPSLRDGVFRYSFKAIDKLGPTSIVFEAAHNETKAKLKTTLSVRPPVNYQFSIWSGELADNNYDIEFKRDLYSELKKEDAVFSQNPLIAMDSVSEFLVKYPYGCSEQIISQAFATAVIGTIEGSRVSKAQTLQFHQNALRTISQRLTYDGIQIYPGSDRKPGFVSLYAYLYMQESKKRFLTIPKSLENRVLTQVKKVFNDSNVYLEKAMAAYLLAKDQTKAGIYLSRLQKFIESDNRLNTVNHLGHLYAAATFKLLGREKEALQYLDKYQFLSQSFKNYSFYHTQHLHNTMGLYLLTQHFLDAADSPDRQISTFVKNVFNNLSGQINSLSLAMSLMALDSYFEDKDFKAIDGVQIVSKTMSEDKKVQEENLSWDTKKLFKLDLEKSPRGLKLLSSAKEPVYFTISRSGFDKKADIKELVSGLQVTKNIFDDSNSPVTRVSLGDEVLVEINIQAKDGKNHQNVAVVELLPGGFEPVLELKEGNNVELSSVEYFDRREDRIVFYMSASDATRTIRYRMKAVNKGSFILPGVFAEDMYDVKVRAHSKAKRIEIVD